jgi:hypothetical protein
VGRPRATTARDDGRSVVGDGRGGAGDRVVARTGDRTRARTGARARTVMAPA